MPIKNINHEGFNVILISYEDCKTKEDISRMAYKTIEFLSNHPDHHLRILFDYSEGFVTREYMKVVKEGRESVLEIKTVTSAAIGVTGIKKVLLQGYNAIINTKGIKPFDKKEDALNYLITEEC